MLDGTELEIVASNEDTIDRLSATSAPMAVLIFIISFGNRIHAYGVQYSMPHFWDLDVSRMCRRHGRNVVDSLALPMSKRSERHVTNVTRRG
jgi:hypothetical protein